MICSPAAGRAGGAEGAARAANPHATRSRTGADMTGSSTAGMVPIRRAAPHSWQYHSGQRASAVSGHAAAYAVMLLQVKVAAAVRTVPDDVTHRTSLTFSLTNDAGTASVDEPRTCDGVSGPFTAGGLPWRGRRMPDMGSSWSDTARAARRRSCSPAAVSRSRIRRSGTSGRRPVAAGVPGAAHWHGDAGRLCYP